MATQAEKIGALSIISGLMGLQDQQQQAHMMKPVAQEAARRYMSLGTPGAQQMGQLWLTRPDQAARISEMQYGGMEEAFRSFQGEALQQRMIGMLERASGGERFTLPQTLEEVSSLTAGDSPESTLNLAQDLFGSLQDPIGARNELELLKLRADTSRSISQADVQRQTADEQVRGAELDVAKQEIELPGVRAETRQKIRESAEGFRTPATIQNETSLLSAFDKQSASFEIQQGSFEKILILGRDDTGASDLGLVFSFMKLLDPPSSVREGEVATAQNAGGVGQRWRDVYNKVAQGSSLDPTIRRDIIEQSANIFEGARTGQTRRESRFGRRAEAQGIRPELVDTYIAPELAGDLTPLVEGLAETGGISPGEPQPATAESYPGATPAQLERLREMGLIQ